MTRRIRNPDTGEPEDAEWVPCMFGPVAGIRFPSRPGTWYWANAFDDFGGLEFLDEDER